MGMRITTKNAINGPISDELYKTVLTHARSNYFDAYSSDFSKVNKTNPGLDYTETGGYQGNGGFVKFFKGNASYNTTYETYKRMLKNYWFRDDML